LHQRLFSIKGAQEQHLALKNSAHDGYDGITPDQHPLLGAAGPDGFYPECGHSGTGFKTALTVGLCMAELILDGEARTVDIEALRPGRFAEGKMVKGNYANIWRKAVNSLEVR
jgi:glycine/D-amino acid oxidase-like deaminating enzyme